MKKTLSMFFALVISFGPSSFAGSYTISFASQPDRIFHPSGVEDGLNVVEVRICIDPGSSNIQDMEGPLLNAIRTWNKKEAVIGNISTGDFPDEIDFESVALHEIGHCVFGLAHVNGASESMLPTPQRNSTVTYQGDDSILNIDAGIDGVFGSSDDLTGDDVNRFWYTKYQNDPFALPLPNIIDATSFQRSLPGLPAEHNFAANGNRAVSAILGYPPTESVMFQDAVANEIQRTLTADDVATVKFAESGFDNLSGTPDDYTSNIIYAGVGLQDCDVVVAMEGVLSPNCAFIEIDHFPPGGTQDSIVVKSKITFSPLTPWHYNPEQDPDEDSVALLQDNCSLVANTDQRDTNNDGFGNICDPDFDGNCRVNHKDVSLFVSEFGGANPDYDLNGDGAVDLLDYAIVTESFLLRPGPSYPGDVSCPFGSLQDLKPPTT
ncbi:MAG: matrixin family metalloprotease [Gammaproteobacteria bacterium]